MAETLGTLGFTLIGGRAQLDLDKAAMDGAVQNFGRQVQGADVALFYYAGHGVQVAGSNYLVPVSANPTREADVDFQMVDVNLVLRQMQGSGTRLNMVILDACRNNPFGARGLRASDGGLAQMQAPEGTLISYATQPGNVALDGDDSNSPYSSALSAMIRRPGLGLFEVFNEVGLAVKKSTGGAQQPWVSSSPIAGRFYFSSGPSAEPASSSVSSAPPRDPAREDFELAQRLDKREVWEAYVEKYPTALYASIAKSRLSELKTKLAAVSPEQIVAPPVGNIAGAWNGVYSYANGKPVAFRFDFASGTCTGRSEEPNTFGQRDAPK